MFHLNEGNRAENKISFKKENETDAVSSISNINRKKRVSFRLKELDRLWSVDVRHSFFLRDNSLSLSHAASIFPYRFSPL